jgi:outer membrane protein TolC
LEPTFDLPIETAGKRGYRIAQATQLSEAARLDIATTAWQVRGKVRRSLLDLYSARETQKLLKEQQDILSENVGLLVNQFNAGAISAFELTQARLAEVSGRIALRDAEAQSADALAQLADAIGLPVAALAGVQISFDSLAQFPGTVPAAEARRQALLNRADILSALADYAASQSALQLQIATQYPDIHLNPAYEFDQGNNEWAPGFTVTLPVLNQNQGPIAEAQAQCVAAAASFNALQARVISDIDRALAVYDMARKKREDVEAMLADLQKQQKTCQAMYDAGEISKSELAAQQLQLSAVALARLDALSKSQLALAQLEDALQSPLGLPVSAWQAAPRISAVTAPNPQP